jgi:hypothetical protein
MWLAWDFENVNFPVPVFLNRLAAARFVLIFGMVSAPCGLFLLSNIGGAGKNTTSPRHLL